MLLGIVRVLAVVSFLVLVFGPTANSPPAISDTGQTLAAMEDTARIGSTADTHWFSTVMEDTSVALATARSGVTFEVSSFVDTTTDTITDDDNGPMVSTVFITDVRNNFNTSAFNTAEFGFAIVNIDTVNGETVTRVAVQQEVKTDDFVSSRYRSSGTEKGGKLVSFGLTAEFSDSL